MAADRLRDELRGMAEAEVKRQLDGLCAVGRYCPRHNFVHGAEAEELRSKFEALAEEFGDVEGCGALARAMKRVLDGVDARDSLAWSEVRKKLEEEESD